MSGEEFYKLLSTIAVLISVTNALWLWLRAPTRLLEAKLDKFKDETEEDVRDLDRRVQAAESNIKHLPTSEDLKKIELKANGIKIETDMIMKTVMRIEDYLREGRR